MKKLLALGIGTSVLLSGMIAEAATFNLRIKNTSSIAWTEGLVSTAPFLSSIGIKRPQPGTRDYQTYLFGSRDCNVDCGSGCSDTGNAAVLVSRLGLTLGVDAWYVPAIPAGQTKNVTITVTSAQKISYVSHVVDSMDDVVMITQSAPTVDPTMLSIGMFDVDLLPYTQPPFAMTGFDLNSTSSTNGDGASCAAACPPPTGDTCYMAVSNGSTGGPLPAQPLQPALTSAWAFAATGYTPDGIALGDVTNASGNELVVSMEGAKYYGSPPYVGTGRALVLSNAGASQSTFDDPTANHDFMGFPMIENLDGSGRSEFLVTEYLSALTAPGGALFARFSTASKNWSSTGYGYPAFWNMGPTAGDVRSDLAGNEVVVSDWDGNVTVLRESDGTKLNTYNVWNDLSVAEHIYGHAAVGDVVSSSAGNEIVVFGAQTGRAIALKATSAGMSVLWKSEVLPAGRAYGSGAAIGNIDGDASNEIVVEAYGSNRVFAYDTASTGCKYYWDVPGISGLYWTSPVIGDVDGDARREVVVFDNKSRLAVLSTTTTDTAACKQGTVVWTYTVGAGGSSWFTPALGQLSGGSKLDVVVANYQTIEVVDVEARTVALRYTDSSARFYPSAVFEGFGTSQAAIYVSGWINGKVYRLDTPASSGAPTAWSSFMGGNSRNGAR